MSWTYNLNEDQRKGVRELEEEIQRLKEALLERQVATLDLMKRNELARQSLMDAIEALENLTDKST